MIATHNSLKAFNTFSIEASAQCLFHFNDFNQLSELLALVKRMRANNQPVLILGAGSNTLFCEDVAGLVIKVELTGIEISESNNEYILRVGAGENWHQLVTNCIEKGIDGLENLALIPGVVGAAPVQNIGAYGVEFKDFCESVEYLDLDTGEFFNLTGEQCLFAYRDSIFKTKQMCNALITKVTLKLNKARQAHSRDGSSQKSDSAEPRTAKQVYDSICQIRSEKLPDPERLGNAGSFFKNPVISKEQAQGLLNLYPELPNYPQADGQVKLAAAWLIEQADLKGTLVGGAAVHKQQALVLINQHNASARDIVQLAELVRSRVETKFNISLEHEVRFIGKQGESCLKEMIKHVGA